VIAIGCLNDAEKLHSAAAGADDCPGHGGSGLAAERSRSSVPKVPGESDR
jgi:hypothetical protein